MRFLTPDEFGTSRALDQAWKWVENTCRAVLIITKGTDEDTDDVLQFYDEVTARIEAKGMTGTALIEETIRWAHEKITKEAQ